MAECRHTSRALFCAVQVRTRTRELTAPARVDGQITLSGDGRVIGRRDGERDHGGRGPGRARERGVRELGVAGSGALNQFVMDEDFKAQKPPSSGNAGAVTLAPSTGGGGYARGRGRGREVSEKRRQGQLRREARQATIDGMMASAVTSLGKGPDKVVYQGGSKDKHWEQTRQVLDKGVMRPSVESKYDKLMAFKQTSDMRTARRSAGMHKVMMMMMMFVTISANARRD